MNDIAKMGALAPQADNRAQPGVNPGAQSQADLSAFWMPFTANRQYKAQPRLLARAEGMHYYTPEGRAILDATAGLWCVNAGHCRKPIVEAIAQAAGTLDFAPTFQMGHPAAFELSSRLVALAGKPFSQVFYTNSGSEAVDSALKMAIAYHRARGEGQRTRLIGRERGYNGVGFGGISVGGIAANRKTFSGALLPAVDHLPRQPQSFDCNRGLRCSAAATPLALDARRFAGLPAKRGRHDREYVTCRVRRRHVVKRSVAGFSFKLFFPVSLYNIPLQPPFKHHEGFVFLKQYRQNLNTGYPGEIGPKHVGERLVPHHRALLKGESQPFCAPYKPERQGLARPRNKFKLNPAGKRRHPSCGRVGYDCKAYSQSFYHFKPFGHLFFKALTVVGGQGVVHVQ